MTLYDIKVTTIDGKTIPMSTYKGRILLIVNVASKCSYTQQYAGLDALYRNYKSKGLTVLGFPCDQFGNQEPGDEQAIQRFCSLTYDVTFPMFSKIEVNGSGTHPLYVHLKAAKPGLLGTEAIKWNFTKFLVGPDGTVLKRYAPTDTPDDIEPDIVARLS